MECFAHAYIILNSTPTVRHQAMIEAIEWMMTTLLLHYLDSASHLPQKMNWLALNIDEYTPTPLAPYYFSKLSFEVMNGISHKLSISYT